MHTTAVPSRHQAALLTANSTLLLSHSHSLLQAQRHMARKPRCLTCSNARAAALATMQDEAMRTSGFDALIANVYEYDEQQRSGAIQVLLAQLPGLPSPSRRDALNNLLLLCADVPAAVRPGLYSALAQSVKCLPIPDRSPALRDIASGTRGIAAQHRAPVLAAIAEALSALPDAQTQKTGYQMLRRLLEGVPVAAQLPVLEALAKVNWRDTDLGRDCAQSSLHALAQMADSPCAPLLALLAANLPTIPEAHRSEQFQAILAYTVRLTAQEQAGIQQRLRDALRHLPVQDQSAARAAIHSACMPAQSEIKPSALATNLQDVPRMNGRTFMQSITDAEKRSPVNRASALLQLAASLDLLSQEQRQTCFHALLEAARGLPPRQRGQVLERAAMEIGQLPQPARASAWQTLNELAGNLPDQAQAEVLMCFCAAVSSLPEEHLIDAVSTVLDRAASLAEPSGALGSSLAGIIASLPEHSRMAAVELMIKRFERHGCQNALRARTRARHRLARPACQPSFRRHGHAADRERIMAGKASFPSFAPSGRHDSLAAARGLMQADTGTD